MKVDMDYFSYFCQQCKLDSLIIIMTYKNRAQFLYNAIYLSHENLIKLIFVKNALNVFGYIYFLQ